MQQRLARKNPIATLLAATVLAGALGGCAALRSVEPSSSLAATTSSPAGADRAGAADALAARYDANPGDPQAAMAYAQDLRKNGQRSQAVAVLQQASLRNPANMELLGVYGRALAEAGDLQQALDVLTRAHTPDHPDWRILSAQGAVLDQMGRHTEAQRYYETALKIVPGEPSVLSNLGLSYALSKDLPRAEATLKRAAAGGNVDPRVRQNLALVVGLQGRFAEAENIARADLPPDEAAANVAYLRDMLSREGGALKGGRVSAADGSRRG